MPRVCEAKRSENGGREMQEMANVEDGEWKTERTAERNMIADGAVMLVSVVVAQQRTLGTEAKRLMGRTPL